MREALRRLSTDELVIDMADVLGDRELARLTGLSTVLDEPSIREKRTTIIPAKPILRVLDARLRKAVGDEEVLDLNIFRGGEFRVPNYRSYMSSLEDVMWTACTTTGYTERLRIVPYNEIYDGYEATKHQRRGFMASAMNVYEFAYTFWDAEYRPTRMFAPDLFEPATFGAWLWLLPQPVSLEVSGRNATLRWGKGEPRVFRSGEMGRYQLRTSERIVRARGVCPEDAKVEAYVQAWEKMAANEPEDRYRQAMLDSIAELDARAEQGLQPPVYA